MTEGKDAEVDLVEFATSQSRGAGLTRAQRATDFEAKQHNMTKKEAIFRNWKAILWCFYMFYLCIMWGFDGLAGGLIVSITVFREKFGTYIDGAYVLSASWQLAFSGASIGGIIMGGLVSNYTVKYVGRQPTVAVAFLLTTAGVGVQVFTKSDVMFFGGKLLTGIPLGIFTTVAPGYASEIAPLPIRGAITAGMNFAIVLGQMIAYGVFRQASFYEGKLQYQVLFATQWGFVALGVVFLPFFPESPYWLISHGRQEKARENIVKLHNKGYDVDGDMAMIQETLNRTSENKGSHGTLRDCFTKTQWKRTLVATSVYFIQNSCGPTWVIGYMTYFMELGGLPATQALRASIGITGLMVVGNMAGWVFVEWFGRRGSFVWGSFILCVILFLIGIMASVHASGAIWVQVSFMFIWSFVPKLTWSSTVYQSTVGSAAWPITTENATSCLRAPTQALATVVNGLSSCIWTSALPYAINPDQGNLGGKIAFIFGAVLAFSTMFAFFMIPETKGLTYIEIDTLWERGVCARQFKSIVLVSIGGTDVEKANP